MNVLNIDSDDREQPEPFATILELLTKHSEADLLQAISDTAEFESQDQELPASFRRNAGRLHLELEQLLERMADFEEVVDAAYLETESPIGNS